MLPVPRAYLRLFPMRAAALTPRYNSTRLYTSTMHDNDPEVLEREKHRNLKRSHDNIATPHDHAPGWNEALASVSEAAVKADQSKDHPSEMQSKTVEFMRTRRLETEGTEGENRVTSTTAIYTRDEVSGPLSGAVGKEDVNESWMTPSEEDVKADRGEI